MYTVGTSWNPPPSLIIQDKSYRSAGSNPLYRYWSVVSAFWTMLLLKFWLVTFVGYLQLIKLELILYYFTTKLINLFYTKKRLSKRESLLEPSSRGTGLVHIIKYIKILGMN